MEMEMNILSRSGNMRGEIVNPMWQKCRMEGCTGWRMRVKWENGEVTCPCSKGCKTLDEHTLQIM